MWLHKRILKISRTVNAINDEVLKHIEHITEPMYLVKIRIISYLGHILWNDKYVQLHKIMQEKSKKKDTERKANRG